MVNEYLNKFIIIFGCFFVAFVMVRKYRGFVSELLMKNLKPNESIRAAWKRGAAEHAMNAKAPFTMLGSYRKTLLWRLVILVMDCFVLWCFVYEPVAAWAILAYQFCGVLVALKLGLAENKTYERLLFSDRLMYLLVRGLDWPILLVRRW